MLNNLIVETLPDTGWRVCDRRRPINDARHILGFIEKKGERFEAMEMNHGFEWFTFDSLGEATEHFEREVTGAPTVGQHALSWMNSQP